MDFWVLQFQNYERALGRGVGGEGSRQKSLMPTTDSVGRDALTFEYITDRLLIDATMKLQAEALSQLQAEQVKNAEPANETYVLSRIREGGELSVDNNYALLARVVRFYTSN